MPNTWRRLREQQRRSRHADDLMRKRVRRKVARAKPVNPVESAEIAGLKYVNHLTVPGIRRIGRKTRVRYLGPNGRPIANRAELQRIRSLVIPPAWKDV